MIITEYNVIIVEYNVIIVEYNVIIVDNKCYYGGASRGVGLSFSIPIILY